jgi:hypothetical protein
VGVVQDQEASFGSHQAAQVVLTEPKTLRLDDRQRDGSSTGVAGDGLVDGEAGIGIDDLVPLAGEGHDRVIEEGLPSGAYHYLLGAIVSPAAATEKLAAGLTQVEHARRRAVVGKPACGAFEGLLDDRGRRQEVGVPDLQVDDAAPLPFQSLCLCQNHKGALRPQPSHPRSKAHDQILPVSRPQTLLARKAALPLADLDEAGIERHPFSARYPRDPG